jgi:tRNA (guanine37-N1)-methyltransferase
VDPAEITVEKTFLSFVIPSKNTSAVIKVLRRHNAVAVYPSFQSIRPEGANRRILLAEGIDSLPAEITETYGDLELIPFVATLTHHNFSLQELLKLLLPPDVVIPSSFETIGHIAHLNLLDEQLPYKYIIGRSILLKNPVIKTVVTKVGSIHNIYRSMDLEILAGEANFETEVRQSGLRFQLDFSTVYWNSRLEYEHDSLVETFAAGAVVADAMCGIGPFAVRAAIRKKCHVFANDLNPDSYKWLLRNTQINKVSDLVQAFNMDAREFIRRIFSDGGCDYIIMNLPASAVEFLDVIGECAVRFRETARLPIVHFHAFDTKEQDYEKSLRQRAKTAIGMEIPGLAILKVRDVSPGKDMFRCSFSVADLFGEDGPSAADPRPE